MARSIGDHAVKAVGVTAEPEVRMRKILPGDRFIVIASDGVWEFLSSVEVMVLVQEELQKGKGSSTAATAACETLIARAANKWQAQEGDYRDDYKHTAVRQTHTAA
eukprot:17578-Heterococcus_DN1.PRE.2